jgi:hypothetical protein
MKTIKKQNSKFQLDTFEVAKIKNMKVILGGDSGAETGSNTFHTSSKICKTR